ncbi:uncharacterized protein [Clytia hemisphaerica]|uniref:uncharacterized protein n=1 Tax=Clytia hemisphaerica TaxID=252671 RepID=UPI0034D5F0EC
MVKPEFKLQVKKRLLGVSGKPNCKAEAIVKRKNINQKELQIEEAVNWCKENRRKGHSALKTGMFPLIKDRSTIDRRLNGNKVNSKKEHLRVLTPAEERSSRVEAIEKEKKERKAQKEERHQQRNNQKELFFKCITKSMCKGVCAAIGLKQCPVCSEVKKSVCGKAACHINGLKPVMILVNSKSKTGDYDDYDDYDDDAYDDFDDGDEESECEGDEGDKINEDEGNESE